MGCRYKQLPSFPGSAWMSGQPGSSCTQGQDEEGDDNEEDVIDLLDDAEALELVQFNPSVQDESTWEAGDTINTFLEKHFRHQLPPGEREAIRKDFPKPACPALGVPKLDEEIKEQIKKGPTLWSGEVPVQIPRTVAGDHRAVNLFVGRHAQP